ncbi:MAG: glycine zipper family protein [Planctomycetes bacterium]|nr:glycine zipper family protein [Planctomycetota bacterium]
MNPRSCWLSLLVFAGCAAAPTVGRAPQVPPLDIAVPQADLTRDEGTRAAADRRPAMPMAEEPMLPSSSNVAYRTFTQTVEVPVEVVVEREVPVAGEPYYVGTRGYRDWYDYDRARRRGTWFPVNTVVGAGVGAIIGHQRGHRGRGALIGAHAGLLLDVARWWH